MMKKLTLILALAAGGPLTGPLRADDTLPDEQAWRDSLGSPDFQKRYEAAMDIWKAGDDALPVLEKLVAGDDPELAARAGGLSLKIRAGITPDTPAEFVAQLDLFFATNATSLNKIAVLEELRRLEQFDFIIRLRSLETDERVIGKADEIIEAALPNLIRERTSEGRIDEVKFLLSLSKDFQSMIAFANLVDQEGTLGVEIARLRASDEPGDRARYLACLRVKGDAGLLQFEAHRLGDRQAEALASLALGQYVPYLEYLGENQDLNLSDRHYLDWTLAEARGDRKKAEEAKEALLHLTKERSEMFYARRNLFRMGFRDEVVEGFRPSETDKIYDYLVGQEEYDEILPVMGLPEGKLTGEWLAENEKALKSQLDEGRDDVEAPAAFKYFVVAGFFEARGEVGEAVRCFESLFNVVSRHKESKLSTWLAAAFGTAPRATIHLLAEEASRPGFDPDTTLEEVFSFGGLFPWLYKNLGEIYPETSIEKRLLLAASFTDHTSNGIGSPLLVSEEEFEEAQEQILQRVLKSEDKAAGLNRLLNCAQSRQWRKDIEKFVALLEDEGAEISEIYRGTFAATTGKFEEAAKHFAEVEIDEKQSSIILIYQKGTAMMRGGVPGGEEYRRKARLYGRGSASELMGFAAIETRYRLTDEAYEMTRGALLRIDLSSDESRRMSSGYLILSQLAEGAMERRNYEKALAFYQALAWETTTGSSIYNTRARFWILLARGAIAKREGDLVEAVELFTKAHSLMPRDGFLANEFFPLVRGLGLVEMHDQLFAKTARLLRETIARYPKDDNALNNFSWSASRANRRLAEAEDYLKKALEMKPRSAAYLDTMGEIYFARRNREEAIRWSDLSLGYEMNDVQLIGQNQRFHHGDFPAP